jgi:hypothetical protein
MNIILTAEGNNLDTLINGLFVSAIDLGIKDIIAALPDILFIFRRFKRVKIK